LGSLGDFYIDGMTLYSNKVFDWNNAPSYDLAISSTDPYGGSVNEEFTITINDMSEPPTAINLDCGAGAGAGAGPGVCSVLEDVPVGSVIGDLSATDPDSGQSHSFSIVGMGPSPYFRIEGNQLLLAKPLTNNDEEEVTDTELVVKVKATDNGVPHKSLTALISIMARRITAPTTLASSSNQRWF